ncbi:hypothetical protein J7F03_34310 [Streptomyces sp. ISL-43]|uniref:hypothetical protein n=1 Tax=Streptomyces sp. ISL-43 TaxID=2819183 RepID=UPI001BE70B39|nr:hypothetical protein [Streptomyces sp. ISL-43]MBT2452046.1 hypothetical protein [Streptomyces sp. ISL-43]
MGYSAGRRRGDRHGTEPQPTRQLAGAAESSRILIVTPGPGTAAVFLREEPGTGPVTVLCLEAGTAQERADFTRAAEEAAGRGCPVDGPPRTLPADDPVRALLRELRAVAPDRVLTCDPLALREEGARGERESALAIAVLDAVEEYQAETGRPVFTDCRVLDTEAWPAPASRSRYPAPSAWAVCGSDGRVSAYLPVPGAVARWTEGADGNWTGPELLEAPGMLPALTVLQDPDGYVELMGLRRTGPADGEWNIDVGHVTQYQSGRPPGPWYHQMNPHRSEPLRGRFIGVPVAAYDADGTLHVFVRNDGHHVNACRRRPDGVWSSWGLLRGARVEDEMVALRGADGKVELYARHEGKPGLVRWHRPDARWAVDLSPNVHALAGSLAAAPESGALRYRYAESGELCQWPLGSYGPMSLNGPAARGRANGAAGVHIDGWSCTVLAVEDEQGNCAIGAYVDGRPDGGVWWISTAQRALMPPVAVRKHDGTVIVITIGSGARLAVARQVTNGPGLEFEPWLDLSR